MPIDRIKNAINQTNNINKRTKTPPESMSNSIAEQTSINSTTSKLHAEQAGTEEAFKKALTALDEANKEIVNLKRKVEVLTESGAKLSENYAILKASLEKVENNVRKVQSEETKHYKNLATKINDQAMLGPSWSGVCQNKRSPQIIVSMTTYPARIHSVRAAIKSIMTQSIKADRIILWLAKSDFPLGEAELPSSLLELKEKGLEIRWCDVDYLSYKKILPALKEFPDDLVVTADDDLIYPDTMLEQLYHSWEQNPKCISALRVHKMAFNKDYSIAPYNKWTMEDSSCIGVPRFELFATTGAGAIFPPHCLPEEALNWDAIEKLCPNADDVWIKMMSLINDVPTVLTSKQNRLVYIEGTQEGSTLWKFNRVENDEQIKKVIEAYPVLNEKIFICAKNRFRGPALSDKKFFTECLNLQYSGLEQVREHVLKGRFTEARKAFATHIRETLQPEQFFSVPYEEPENIYKLPYETDIEACKRISRHGMVSVGIPYDFGADRLVDWCINPTENNYREWTWQLNRHNELKMLAHEYKKTGEEWLADTAADLFTSWVRQAMHPKEDIAGNGTECWRTIECGIRMGANWPYALFSFYKSGAFTDDLLVDWYKSVWEHGNRLSKNHTSGNWLIMEMNGLAQIGILYPQLSRSSEWLKQALESLEQELDKQIYPDGFHYELSTNYHDVVVNNYWRLLKVAKAFNVSVPKSMLNKIENACELYAKLAMPNGKLPDINDGKNVDIADIAELKDYITSQKSNSLTSQENVEGSYYQSVVLPYSGLFVMRSGKTPQSTWALFDAGPFGKMHQHEDKLSVLLYANGKLLLTEGGNYAYDDSEMRRYVLSTRAHNTVRVDGQDQNRRRGYKWQEGDIKKKSGLLTHIGTTWDFGEGSYTEGYGKDGRIQVTHTRRVFFCKEPKIIQEPFLIVVDRMSSKEEHTYEWLWHIDSELVRTGKGQEFSGKVGFSEIDVLFSAGTASVIKGQTDPEWQGFVSTGLVQGMYRELPCVSVIVRAKEFRMVTVIAPHKAQDKILSIKAGIGLQSSDISLLLAGGEKIEVGEFQLITD